MKVCTHKNQIIAFRCKNQNQYSQNFSAQTKNLEWKKDILLHVELPDTWKCAHTKTKSVVYRYKNQNQYSQNFSAQTKNLEWKKDILLQVELPDSWKCVQIKTK